MLKESRTFRIFVSSTFSDLKEERDALQKEVFPKLRNLCMLHGCRFQAIDLRWGVSIEAAHDQQTMNICFQELKRCQKITPKPNFIILLGNRYGWCPLPPQIEAEEFEEILSRVSQEERGLLLWDEKQPNGNKGWYRRDDNALPTEYCLMPREVKLKDSASSKERQDAIEKEEKEWEKTEKNLRSIILCAIDKLGWPKDNPRRIKYEASATHQEILNGALTVPDAHEHVYCFFRKIENLPQNPIAKDFIDIDKETGHLDSKANQKLQSLKDSLYHYLKGNIFEYRARWTGNTVTTYHLGKLCDDVYNSLSRVIIEQAAALEKADELENEIENHESFGMERAKFFTGRATILQTISDYIKGTDNHPLAIYGESGSGKTALMAYAAKRAQEENPEAKVIYRYIGATPSSSDGRTLLESLCRQISRCYNAEESLASKEYGEVVQEFDRRLLLATESKPLFLFLDALDQLYSIGHFQSLSWLPVQLPEYVRIIVTCLPDMCISTLRKKLPAENLLKLEPMSLEEGGKLLNLWLTDTGRTIQPHQRAEILGKFQQCGLPLYLKLVLEEACRWNSYTKKIALSSDVPGIIRNLLERLSLEANHGRIMVSRSLGYLAAAKNGLTEDELLDVLSLDKEVIPDFLRRSPRSPVLECLPVVIWSRLYFDLKSYLTERTADGASLINFYHRQFAETITKELLTNEAKRQRHEVLAQFFGCQPLWMDKDSRKTINLRKLSELPFQQTFGHMWSELESTLTDLKFATVKCIGRMLFDLVRDYDRALEATDLPAIAQVRQALLLAVPGISARPALTAQFLYNHLIWVDRLDSYLQARLERARLWLDEKGYWIRAEAPFPGQRASEIRSIPFEIDSGIQALSSDKNAIAIASWDGEIEIRHSSNGEPIERRRMDASRIVGIALCEASGSPAYIDVDGVIHVEHSAAFLPGRKGEKVLAYHPANCVLAVRDDDALVAWDVNRDACTVLDTNLPVPLTVLRISLNSRNILYVAGFKQQVIGIVLYLGESWEVRRLSYNGPPVIDADLDNDGVHVLIASVDRALRVLDIKTSVTLAQLSYECLPEIVLRGRPEKCALGFGETSACAFIATHDGHVACWEWEKDIIVRLEDYRTVSETITLVLFDIISSYGQLFLSATNYGKVFTRRSLRTPTSRHIAAVSACTITAYGKIVSTSALDHTVRWYSADELRPLGYQYYRGPTVVVPRGETDDVVIGDQEGMVWNQKPNIKVDPKDIFMAFAEEVVSIFDAGNGCIIATGKSGRALRIHLFEDKVDVLWHSTGFQTQRKILPDGPNGLFWSLRQDQQKDGIYSVLSLVKGVDEEEVVISIRENIEDVTVSRDGTTICFAGQSVRVLRNSRRQLTTLYHRDVPVSHVAFLGEDEMIAVVLSQAPWLEVWRVAEGLSTLAAVSLPSEISCIYTRGYQIVAGCRSGDLISISVNGPVKRIEDWQVKEQ